MDAELLAILFAVQNAGDGSWMLKNKAMPVFSRANIETTVLVTEAVGHATEDARKRDFSNFDGIVCVGGDGFMYEGKSGNP